MLLMIDNYDSFTFNLVQYFGELGQKVKVLRNDEVNLDQIEDLNPEFIVISPGPCTPNEAGISIEAIKEFSGKIPILGVCLGHQAIGAAFGAKIIKANRSAMASLEKNVKNFKIPPKTNKTMYAESVQDDWFVQIGAFKNRLNAHKAARNARNIVPEQLGNLPASLSKITKTNNANNNLEYLWRVRFIELAENQARSVCAELWTSGLSCIPLPSNNKS